MKKTMEQTRPVRPVRALLAVMAAVFLFGACPDANVNNGGDDPDDPVTITFDAEQVGGETDETTGDVTASSTGIKITFSAPVSLSFSEVAVAGAAVMAGFPAKEQGGNGTVWTIPVTVGGSGTAEVTITKDNVDDTPVNVDVYKAGTVKPKSWTVEANGVSGLLNTTLLTFTFDAPVAGLAIGSFTINPSAALTKVNLSSSADGTVWELAVTVTDERVITVTILHGGVASAPKEVQIFHDGILDDYWNNPYDPYYDDWDPGVTTEAGTPHIAINSYAELGKLRYFGTNLTDSSGNVLYQHDGNGNYIFQTNGDGSLQYETEAGGAIAYKKNAGGQLVYKVDQYGQQMLDSNGQPIPIPLPKRIVRTNPNATRGNASGTPLIIQFTANCDKAEFTRDSTTNPGIAKWGANTVGVGREVKDPINAILAAIAAQGGSKYTVWDMTLCGWDGTYPDDFGDSVTANFDYGNESTHRSNANARNRVVAIYFPQGLQAIGDEMFRGWTGLATLSFKNSAVLEIGTRAFNGCTAIRRMDFTGAVNLRSMGNEAFAAATGLATHGTSGVVDLSELKGLTTLGLSTFGSSTGNAGNALMWKLVLPDSPGVNSNNYTFGSDGGGVRQVWFMGNASHYFANNSFIASMGGTGNNNGSTFTNTNRGDRAHGDVVTNRTDKVLEYFYEESLTPTRMYDGYFYHYEHHGTLGFSALIPVKNGQDIYRGQATMTINGPGTNGLAVANAPAGTINVYSTNTATDQYKIGTMTNGIITLTAPHADNRETLRGDNSSTGTGNHPGMKITGDPRDYYTGRTGENVNTSSARGAVKSTTGTVDGFVENATLTSPGAPSTASSHTSVTHWYWWPWIGNNTNNYNRSSGSAAKATIVKSIFYQEGGQWKEIKRKGEDIHSRIYSFYNPKYHLDQHEMMWVWLDKDITLYRVARAGPQAGIGEINYNKNAVAGASQNLYITAPQNIFDEGLRGRAVGVVHSTVNMSLKAGWNQLVTTTRFCDEGPNDWDYRCAWKIVRVWAGLMGPFSSFNQNNPNPMTMTMNGIKADFTRTDGFAFHANPKNASAGPYADYLFRGKQQYVDDYPEAWRQIPWVQQ